MESTPLIYKAMTAAMADIGAVGKEQTNQQQHFRYRGIDDAMNALYPVLAKHGLFLVPEVLEQNREERVTKSGGNLIYSILKVRYTMFASDGSSVSAVVVGEGMDSADKSSNKAIAAAMKYAIFQMFCIPTEDFRDNDPDKETPPESKPLNRKPAGSPPVPAAKAYSPAEEIKAIKQRYQIDNEGFNQMRASLIAGGVIQDKPSAEMTEADWKQLFQAIDQNFGDAA